MIKNMDEILSAASKASKEQLHGYSYTQKEVELVGEQRLEAEEVNWNARGGPGYATKKVSEWNKPDMLRYCLAHYVNLTGQRWSISYGGAQEGIKLMQEGLKRVFGEWPSNRLTKYYLDWFFSERAESLIASYGYLGFKMLRYDRNIEDFAKFCSEQNVQLETQERNVEVVEPESSLTEDAMQSTMRQGIGSFLCSYGLFICYYWLRNKENNDKSLSISKICQSVLDLMNKQGVDQLFTQTENLGPYPSDMKKEFSELIETLARSTGEPFTLIAAEYTDAPQNKSLFE